MKKTIPILLRQFNSLRNALMISYPTRNETPSELRRSDVVDFCLFPLTRKRMRRFTRGFEQF